MESRRDINAIQKQLKLLKENNQRSLEYLSAIQLLMVEDNNGKSKDSGLSTNFNNLSSKLNHLSEEIELLMNNIDR